MSLQHERDIEWADDTFTLPNDVEFNDEPIQVVFEENHFRAGGSYAVWFEEKDRGAPILAGVGLDRAKRKALELQREYGNPITETVDRL